jgi:isocitrate dehydrogenase (NAD+)
MGTQHIVMMLPGEGTGPELCEAVRLVIDASGVNIK